MEVHAHSHTARKKWTHYLWEFLMLFLAVFCGFMAENIREHRIEHKRANEYLKTLISDLKTDTSGIHYSITQNQLVQQELDTLGSLLDTIHTNDTQQLQTVYRIFYDYGYGPYVVSFSNRTITQLKSSGAMRLIQSDSLSRFIDFYYTGVEVCNKQADTYIEDMNDAIRLSYKFIDKLYQQPAHKGFMLARKLLTENPAAVREFINRISDLKEVIGSYNELLEVVNKMAIKLINDIKQEQGIRE